MKLSPATGKRLKRIRELTEPPQPKPKRQPNYPGNRLLRDFTKCYDEVREEIANGTPHTEPDRRKRRAGIN